MKFRKVQRPKIAQGPRVEPKVLRTDAVVCPWCGAVETLRANRTKKTAGAIIRYSTCARCGRPVTRVVTVPETGRSKG